MLPSTVRRVVAGSAGYAVIGGITTLAGWFAKLPRLTDWAESGISMFANTALAAVCLGVALFLTLLKSRWSARVAGFLGLFVATLGGATLFQHFSGVDLGIDTLLIKPEWGNKAAITPGRMGPPASTSFTILGIALLLLGSGRAHARKLVPALGISVSLIAALSLMGYILGANPLFAVARFTGIAMQTASILFALALAIVASAPEYQPVQTLQANSAAGLLVRRSLPFILALPLVLGWLCVRVQQAGWFDPAMGTSLLVLVLVIVFSILLWWWAAAVGQHEEASRESENRKSAILSASLDAIITMDHEGKIADFNPAAEKIFGYRRDAIIARPLAELIVPERLRQRHYEGLARHLATGESTILGKRIEMPALHADGHEFPVELSISRIVGAEPPMFTATLRDITERERAEAALRKSEERLRFMAESMPQKIFTAKPDGDIDYFNQQWSEFAGLPLEQIRDWGWTQLVHPDDVEENIRRWKRSLETGELFQLEHRFRRKDGVYRWHISRAHAMRDAEGRITMWIGSNTDIDDLKRAEEALKKAQEDLEAKVQERTRELSLANEELTRSNRELEAFAYIASHDLQEPLRMVTSYVQLLQLSLKEHDFSETDEYIHISIDAVNRMRNLINDLLNYSRIRSKPLEFAVQSFDKVLQTAMENLKVAIQETEAEIKNDPLPTLEVDEYQMIQLFQNLIGNAIKFRRKEEHPRIHVSVRKENKCWTICVRDNGIGIEPKYHQKIFQLFQRLHSRERYEGTGIGLAICKLIVERHGGKIWVESEPGKGSTFCFTLKGRP